MTPINSRTKGAHYAATLGWPPSVNRYWRNVKGRTLISREGRAYRATCEELYQREPMAGRLAMTIWAYPPDRRRRDLDNILKAVLDGLGAAGWYEDDSQIDRLLVIREPKDDAGGRIDVRVEPVHVEPEEDDISVCPGCGGPADNGFSRSLPPSPYLCTECEATPEEPNR